MSDPLPNNFLEPEPHIVERLKAALAGQTPAVHVLTAADLEGVKEQAQHVPAVHVIWNGFRPTETRPDGKAAKLQHTWLTVCAVRNVSGARSGKAARAEAGNLVAQVGGALMGFRPPNVAGPLLLADAPGAHFNAGFMYLPLAWTVESIFKAS